ncbi:hypothetical protein E2562_013798 [Oryza meyeriana var. granulata]|uniref:Uncharacterized protein n=1 Tax=Oryza meyeriana var. granulata TaxID=110450 RepID=A0A6G1F861_9ORYZ|nr:hypothetical protein E2562_013798 [Oryza meyeriana var. granulata]
MAAEAAGLLSKEYGNEPESSLESEGGCEEEEDDDMDRCKGTACCGWVVLVQVQLCKTAVGSAIAT